MFNVRLLRGIKEPCVQVQQLVKAEQIAGFWTRLLLLFGVTLLISVISSFLGIGNETLSNKINHVSGEDFEAMKGLYASGQLIWMFLFSLFIILIPSLFFWALSDIEWKKFIVVQFFVLEVLLLEKIVLIPFTIFIGLSEVSNPFSLGVIGQFFTKNSIIFQFLAYISIFKVWALVIQYKYIRALSEKPQKTTVIYVVGFNVILVVISIFLKSMDLEKWL